MYTHLYIYAYTYTYIRIYIYIYIQHECKLILDSVAAEQKASVFEYAVRNKFIHIIKTSVHMSTDLYIYIIY